jgi:hypothetical protein
MRLILSCTGVLVVGVTSVAREREQERERESSTEVSCLSLPSLRLSHSAFLCSPAFAAYVCRLLALFRMAQLYNGGVAIC